MTSNYSYGSRCFLSIAEVAWLLGVENSAVCRAIRQGRVQVVRRRGRVLVRARSLAHLLSDGGVR